MVFPSMNERAKYTEHPFKSQVFFSKLSLLTTVPNSRHSRGCRIHSIPYLSVNVSVLSQIISKNII